MENTYWNHRGTHQELSTQLDKLVPACGPVIGRPSKIKHLERFRKASNAYYDIFNNGGGNRTHSIARFYGSEVNRLLRLMFKDRNYFDYMDGWNKIHAIVEPIIDQIILEAAAEQGIVKEEANEQ